MLAKVLVTTFLLAAALSANAQSNQDRAFGVPNGVMRQLYEQRVYTPGSRFQVVENTFSYPVQGVRPGIIGAIEVQDLMRNGKNAVIALTSGGINTPNATLKFTSQRGEPIDYLVYVWGRFSPPRPSL